MVLSCFLTQFLIFRDKKVFLRDVCVSTVPSAEDLNKDALYKFASLVRTPCSFPERILFEIIEAKERMEEFEKLNIKIKDVDVPKCKQMFLVFIL